MLAVDQDAKKLFERELLLLRMIRSPYFVKIHDILKSKNSFYLILDYCNGGSLKDLMENKKLLSEKEAHYLIKQIVEGFAQLF